MVKRHLIVGIAASVIIAGSAIWYCHPGGKSSPFTTFYYQELISNISKLTSTLSLSIMDSSNSGPKLVDQMKSFQLATNVHSRPNVSWKDGNDQIITLKDFNGKVVMLNFWASWCAPCIRELPSINRLQASFGREKFYVVALNIDKKGKTVARRFKEKLKLDQLNLYVDQDNTVARKLKVNVLPTTIIFDAKGRNLGKIEAAAEWDAKVPYNLIQ